MNLKILNDNLIRVSTLTATQGERHNSLTVLHHLGEVERRGLFAKFGYPSLFEYVVQELKYSAGAGHRRIVSMRLLKDFPEIEEKMLSGALNLSTLAKAQRFFNREGSTRAQKLEILKVLEDKNSREVERELTNRMSDPLLHFQETVRAVAPGFFELKILVDESLLRAIDELRGLLAHRMPRASMSQILEFAVKRVMADLKPKAARSSKAKAHAEGTNQSDVPKSDAGLVPPVEVDAENLKHDKLSRYIPADVKRAVWNRDQGQCGYVDEVSGRCCGSQYGLEYDHIVPFAHGGEATVDNLRLRCRVHNQLEAVNVFGHRLVAGYVGRLR